MQTELSFFEDEEIEDDTRNKPRSISGFTT